MSARVIHVGQDYWHRLQVLRTAGLSVDECGSVEELAFTLRTGTDPHAVLLAASPMFDPAPATAMVRSSKKCPVILFSVSTVTPDPNRYDLVIHPLTDPKEWLDDIWTIIGRTQQLRAQSRATRQTSEKLRRDTEDVTQRTREEKDRSKRLLRESTAANPRKPDGK
ncbi:MAG TPA: hypothetical protein VN678_02010 [Acidobacteriaceae bacterium]|nr:hypothetical protein [Acidobacteriaceae bacterium]